MLGLAAYLFELDVEAWDWFVEAAPTVTVGARAKDLPLVFAGK